VGLAGLVDVIVFHQLLGWHHFYDRSTMWRGLVQWRAGAGTGRVRSWLAWAGSTCSTVWSTQAAAVAPDPPQIRPGVADQFLYDAVWTGRSLLILAAGVGLARGDVRAGPGADLPAYLACWVGGLALCCCVHRGLAPAS
jgi:hypothetical protein